MVIKRVAGLAALAWLGLALPASAAETEVRIGTVASSSDAGFYIADHKGYFAAEGIKAVFVGFDTAAKMIGPLGTGQLDVGGGAPSAALYNAAGRGIGIKIVADKGSAPPGNGFQPLLVRKDLVDSGRYKDFKDLKGMKIANVSPGVSSAATLHEFLKRGGLTEADADIIALPYPQHVVAFHNKGIDASVTIEPSASQAIMAGDAVRISGDDAVYPGHQVSVVLYSGDFAKNQPEVARKFMRAYIRAIRDYNDALAGGKLAGPSAEAIIAILTQETTIKDPALYKAIVSHGTNPDGRVNLDSLRRDREFFKAQGQLDGDAPVDAVVDSSFVEAAVKELGPYHPMGK